VEPDSVPLFEANRRLNDAEYSLRRLHLQSLPRYLTVVLGNGCNIDCPHCYQLKNNDNLLHDAEIGPELRREVAAFFPYLSTLRLQGGEVFALRGFAELVADVAASVDRPLISISTNGTLIDDDWARRLVELPFQSVTFSIDGASAGTFERLRRGARFGAVLANIGRVQSWKRRLESEWPRLDAFFVVMRSNFREMPDFLDLLERLSIDEVAFQLMLVDERNLGREPALSEEIFEDPGEVRELHRSVAGLLAREGKAFRRISFCGLGSLFERHGLDASIVDEEKRSLYPGSGGGDGLKGEMQAGIPEGGRSPATTIAEEPEGPGAADAVGRPIELCRNPWSMLQLSENGDVSLCFLSDPIGSVYESPLARLWNSGKAIAQRSEMVSGRYASAGCSRMLCNWREGKRCSPGGSGQWREMFRVFRRVVEQQRAMPVPPGGPPAAERIAGVRRALLEKERRIRELEGVLADLWEKNGALHRAGQSHIDHLEAANRELAEEIERLKTSAGESSGSAREPAARPSGFRRYLRPRR
jgi:MoaA/NifB/PqqE/SkfB family radical SAM enzyme